MDIKINKLPCNQGNYTKANRKPEEITTIVIHYTGNRNDTAKANCKYFQSPNRNASANYFVDENEIWQSVEDKDISWNASIWNINQHCIGIEMCNSVDFVPQKTKENVRKLVQYLMKKYPTINSVIRHYDCNGKHCPLPLLDNNKWKEFKDYIMQKDKETVKIIINGVEVEVEAVNVDGFNFVKLQDLRTDKISIGYDSKKKKPTIDTK